MAGASEASRGMGVVKGCKDGSWWVKRMNEWEGVLRWSLAGHAKLYNVVGSAQRVRGSVRVRALVSCSASAQPFHVKVPDSAQLTPSLETGLFGCNSSFSGHLLMNIMYHG